MNAHPRRVRLTRLSASMIALGLAVEAVSLRWAHPTAFLVFAAAAGLFVGGGALVFLFTLLETCPDRAAKTRAAGSSPEAGASRP